MDNSKFFKCDCHSHGIEVFVEESEGGEKEVFIMPWKYNFNSGNIPFTKRLRTAYDYLFRKNNLYANEVILDQEKSLELADWIKEKMSK